MLTKIVAILLCVSATTGCGRSPSNDGDASASGSGREEEANGATSYSVASASDLPECNDTRKGHLVFVVDAKLMKYCDTSWKNADVEVPVPTLVRTSKTAPLSSCPAGGHVVEVGLDANRNFVLDDDEVNSGASSFLCNGEAGHAGAAGAEGSAGFTVASSQALPSDSTDLCTASSIEFCYFRGGQVTRFSDGSRLVTATWQYGYVDVGNDQDLDSSAISMLVPPTLPKAYQRLSEFVNRGSGYQNVYLVYTRSPESFQLILDVTPSGGGTFLKAIVPTSL